LDEASALAAVIALADLMVDPTDTALGLFEVAQRLDQHGGFAA
jgi:hypothetical protein